MVRLAIIEPWPGGVAGVLASFPTYVGSRDLEVRAMLAQIGAGVSNGAANLTPPAASTASPVTVDTRYVAAGEVGVGANPLRADLDAVEHTRQCRLQRWQEQR